MDKHFVDYRCTTIQLITVFINQRTPHFCSSMKKGIKYACYRIFF